MNEGLAFTLADEMSLIDNFQARVASVAAAAQAMAQHKALDETTPAKCGARARRSLQGRLLISKPHASH